MKKGCLLKVLIVSTIFFVVLFYILTHNLDDFVINPIKNISTNFILSEVGKELKTLNETPERDSLIVALQKFVTDVKSKDKIHLSKLEIVADTLNHIIKDKIVTEDELQNFKKTIKEYFNYERSKKN